MPNPIIFGALAGSMALAQPFSAYLDADIQQENKVLTKSETLTFGSHSDAVTVLQKKMKNLELFKGEVDGDFGVITEHYVKKLQNKYNLSITGRANKETIYKLLEIERQYYLEPLQNIEEDIDMGAYSEDVKTIQSALHYFGYYNAEIDGFYGPLTKQAAQGFQEDHNIPVKTDLDKHFIQLLKENEKMKKNAVIHTVKQVPTKQTVKETPPISSGGLIEIAKSYIGTPYVWGGESPGGFDCSGYLQYVFNLKGYKIPRTVSTIWDATTPVDKPSVGDLVFYETYKPGPSHAGIYLGNGKFIHAGSSNGVTISDMNISYWQQRYLGAKRVVQ